MSSLALLLLIWPLPFASVHLALAPLDALVLWESKANVAHHLFVYSQRCPLAALYISVTPINLYTSLSVSVYLQLGNQEATWVVADYIASSGSNELSVSKGQQVEIIEPPTASEPDFCLVRLNPQHDDSAVLEGLVPVSVLKPPPGSHKQGSSGTTATSGSGGTSGTAQKSSDNMQDQGKSEWGGSQSNHHLTLGKYT